MANCIGLPLCTLSKIRFSKEKITDAKFKYGAQAKKRENMKLKAYDELEKNSAAMIQTNVFSIFILFIS
jgi:hypothetical protein